MIMNSLPTAGPLEIAMTAVLVLTVLELSRRAIGLIFPAMVVIGLAYALFGQYVPGRLGHRGFDIYFVTETLLLSDVGLWGSLLGVAATIIAVFSLFGAFLLHSGGGATFMDLALRVSGRSTGGAVRSRRSPPTVRHGQRQRSRQCGDHRRVYHPVHEATRLPGRTGRCGRGGGVDRRPTRAADHGSGGVHHG